LAPDLAREHLDPERVRDPWGRSLMFAFELVGRMATVTVRADVQDRWQRLTTVWVARGEVALDGAPKVRSRLERWARREGRLPHTVDEMAQAGVRLSDLRDPWGGPCRASFSTDDVWTDTTRATAQPGSTQVAPVPKVQQLERID